jgi:hypothetical protein
MKIPERDAVARKAFYPTHTEALRIETKAKLAQERCLVQVRRAKTVRFPPSTFVSSAEHCTPGI